MAKVTYNSYAGADIEVWCVVNPPSLLDLENNSENRKGRIPDLEKQLFIEKAELDAAEGLVARSSTSQGNFVVPGILDTFQDPSVNPDLIEGLEIKRIQSEAVKEIEDELDRLKSLNTPTYKKLAECSTISYSIFREKRLVRGLGQTNIKGVTRGIRTVAGSLVFTIFDKAVLHELLEAISPEGDPRIVLVDQIPPVDIFIFFANEYGAVSRIGIYGVDFINEGQVMSIHDLYTENTVNYVARDIDTMVAVDKSSFKEFNKPNVVTADQVINQTYAGVRNRIRLARFNNFR